MAWTSRTLLSHAGCWAGVSTTTRFGGSGSLADTGVTVWNNLKKVASTLHFRPTLKIGGGNKLPADLLGQRLLLRRTVDATSACSNAIDINLNNLPFRK